VIVCIPIGLVGLIAGGGPVSGAKARVCPVNSDVGSLTVWHSAAGLNGVLQSLGDRFTSQFPGGKVVWVAKPTFEVMLADFRKSPVPSRPDVILFNEYAVQQLADSKLFASPVVCAAKEIASLIPAVARAHQANGVQQAVPFNALMPVLIYNKAIIRKLSGVNPESPAVTSAELLALSKRLKEENFSQVPLVIDTAWDGGGPWFVEHWMARSGLAQVDSDNGYSGRATKVLWDSDGSSGGLSWLAAIRPYTLNLGPNVSGTDNLRALIDPIRPSVITVNSSSVVRSIADLLSTGIAPGVELGVAPVPGPQPGALVGGGGWWVPKKANNRGSNLAWQFVRFMTGPIQQASLSSQTGYVPVTQLAVSEPELLAAWIKLPALRVPYDDLTSIVGRPPYWNPVVGPRYELRKLLAKAAQDVWDGADPDAALAKATQSAQQLMADYTNFVNAKR
jgi:sn-glycerol 3-phosphate transport system substrate-binding protein